MSQDREEYERDQELWWEQQDADEQWIRDMEQMIEEQESRYGYRSSRSGTT